MPAKNREQERMLKELLETAEGLTSYGVMSKSSLEKVSALCKPIPHYPCERVVKVRTEVAKMSQAAFASTLNVSVSTIQKWESPTSGKHPSGPAAKLLHLVENKGPQVLLT